MTSAGTHPFDALTPEELHARRSEKWAAYPPDVLPAWVAEMDYPLAEPIRQALAELVGRSDTGYAHAGGLELPEAYAEFAAARYGVKVDPGHAYILQDVMRGVLECIRLFTSPGDGVVVNTPVYPPFYSTIAYAERLVIEAPLARVETTGRYELDLDALERAFHGGARAYLLCNPHNPTGRVFSRQELEAVAELADRHDILVLSDEVHGPLTYPAVEHVPFVSIDSASARDGVTLVSGSKAWNLPGLKCAMVLAGSAARLERITSMPEEVRFGTGILGLVANQVAFRDCVGWLDDTMEYLAASRELAGRLLAERLPAVRWHPPEATYLAWLDCRGLGLGDDPAEAFLERGRVALSPGPAFGSGGAGFARLNLSTSHAILAEAIERMTQAAAV
jgi:cystathionine beta-lyase